MKRAMLLLAMLVPSLAAADHVTVKGTVLEGKVKKVSAKEIVMETVYGKGDLTIPTADVSAIETDAPFHVYQADDGQAVGPIVAITPAALTVAQESGSTEVPFDQVEAAPRDPGPDANWFERQPVERPWWSGHADLAFSSVNSTAHSIALATGFGVKRERGPDRSTFAATYRRSSSSNDSGVSRTQTTSDELRGVLRHEHDFTKRIFGFGSFEAEHDGTEFLVLRLIPKAGAGYKLINTEDTKLSVDTGLAWVSQRYFSSSDRPEPQGGETLNSFLAIAFGAESNLKLPWLKSVWHTRLDYLPSIDDWVNDYQLRGETSLLIPIVDQLSLKASVIDEYNSTPAEDAAYNSVATLLGLTLVY